jgi:prepilin-type N-terminal cleavage/methylation domain-containing protein
MKHTKQKGFTLLEILLVIAAIGILAAIVIVAINPNRQFAQVRDNVRQQNINAIYKALEQIMTDTGSYPAAVPYGTYEAVCGGGNTEECINIDTQLIPTYVAGIPRDPSAENYLIGINPTNNKISVWAVAGELKFIVINPIEGAIASKDTTTPFIIEVKTDNTGQTGNNQFSIPTRGVGYNYDVDWGDGSTSTSIRGKVTKTYSTPGTYEVKISGTFPRIYFNDTGDKGKITTIKQWGTINWRNMESAFSGTNINITATDSPNLSNVTNMKGVFKNSSVNGASLGSWNTGQIVNMSEAFQGASTFNVDISNWNVANVTDMSNMFNGASSFNRDLSSWCVTKIASKPTGFDTGATVWAEGNKPIWGTCPFIITIKTDNTGSSASNQFTIPTTGTGYNYTVRWGDGTVNTGVTGNITKTYSTAGTYRVAITGSFPRIFFNGTGDSLKLIEINNWGSNAWSGSMADAFQGTTVAIKATDAPNLSNVTNMSNMFQSANLTGSSLAGWTLPNADVSNMFMSATNIPSLASWNVSAVTNMSDMFYLANLTGQTLSSWNISNVTNMRYMFRSANLNGVNFANWTLPNADVSNMFMSATNIPSLASWNVSAVTNMSDMFYLANLTGQDLSGWNISNVTNMSYMFRSANLNGVNFANWTLPNASVSYMFQSATNIPSLASWNVGSVSSTNMRNMFNAASNFNQNLSGWCVSSIPTKPSGFDTGATAWTLPRPIWGTCP